jgi:hypothetical protein
MRPSLQQEQEVPAAEAARRSGVIIISIISIIIIFCSQFAERVATP